MVNCYTTTKVLRPLSGQPARAGTKKILVSSGLVIPPPPGWLLELFTLASYCVTASWLAVATPIISQDVMPDFFPIITVLISLGLGPVHTVLVCTLRGLENCHADKQMLKFVEFASVIWKASLCVLLVIYVHLFCKMCQQTCSVSHLPNHFHYFCGIQYTMLQKCTDPMYV